MQGADPTRELSADDVARVNASVRKATEPELYLHERTEAGFQELAELLRDVRFLLALQLREAHNIQLPHWL